MASGKGDVAGSISTLLTSGLGDLTPPPTTTLLGAPPPEKKPAADVLFGDTHPSETAMLSGSNIAAIRTALSTAAVPKADPRKPAARDRKVARQTLTTSSLSKDAVGGTGTAGQPLQISGNAPGATMGKTEIARRRASERLEDDPAQPDPDRTEDDDFIFYLPTDPDPQKIEVNLRRKIVSFQKEGGAFGASQAKHFLDGGGKERRFTREEARGLKPIRDAEEVNRKRFVKSLLDNPVPARPEILDPDGGPGSPGRTGFRDRIMNPRAPTKFKDHWVRKFDVFQAAGEQDYNFILGSGRGNLRPTGISQYVGKVGASS